MPAAPHWKKSPPALVALFEAVFPDDSRAERRQMFGYPAGFVNGNLFTGLHQDAFMVRLGESERAVLLAKGAKPFEPMPGRPMREYVVVPAAMHENRRQLASWVGRALDYAASLPRKKKGAPRARKK